MDGYLLASFILGCVAVITLLVFRVTKHKSLDLPDAIVAFLTAAGIGGGIKVCVLAFNPILVSLGSDRLYVFIGGLAVIWVSVQALYKFFVSS